MKHQARKRFGQNFLVDEGIVSSIVRSVNPKSTDNVVEIGPGLSALTVPLLDRLTHLKVIEIDRDLAARLRKKFDESRLSVIEADVLTVDFLQFGERLRVVGNLPYNISSPLLFHLLTVADHVYDQHFMLQREVIDRMAARPGDSEYSRLSVVLQARYDIEKLYDVPPEAFDPPPKVVSSVVRMIPLPSSRPQPISQQAFEETVALAFAQRRKMLRKSLAQWGHIIQWDELGISDTMRPQELSVEQFMGLSNQLFSAGIFNR